MNLSILFLSSLVHMSVFVFLIPSGYFHKARGFPFDRSFAHEGENVGLKRAAVTEEKIVQQLVLISRTLPTL